MTKRNQNSIIALATLGVYLGLLLAGATPGVLAQQAALTKQFNIKDEIERKDDLDKDPIRPRGIDKDTSADLKFDQFTLAYSRFVIDEYENSQRFGREISQQCPGPCRLSYLTYFPTFSPDLERILGITEYSTKSNYSGEFLIYEMEVMYSPSHTEISKFQSAFINIPEKFETVWSPATSLIRANSNVSVDFKNGHLEIVTRLPRGSLDSLLATDAK